MSGRATDNRDDIGDAFDLPQRFRGESVVLVERVHPKRHGKSFRYDSLVPWPQRELQLKY